VTLTLGRYAQADDATTTQGMVFVDGSEGASVQFAPCCRPIPGDAIVGYLGRGEGLVVHTADCQTGKRLFERDSERWIAGGMGRGADARLRDQPVVLVHNGKGVLAQVAAAISRRRGRHHAPGHGPRTGRRGHRAALLVGVRDRVHLAECCARCAAWRWCCGVTHQAVGGGPPVAGQPPGAG
jgi:GTP diphosphokinase / guanosine-3',5'-bis(diphosphate) 3'-diphosphatase